VIRVLGARTRQEEPRHTESAQQPEAYASFAIPEGGSDGARRMNDFAARFDELHFFQGLVEGHRSHFTGFEANHATELTFGDEIGSGNAEARSEDAVEGSGRTAALDVAEDGDADFLVEHFAKNIADDIGNAAGTDRGKDFTMGIMGGKLHAFGDDDDAEMLSAEFTGANGVTNSLKFKGDFGDEDDVSTASNPGMERDPTGVAAHELNEHDAMMAFGGGVEAIDGFGGDDESGVKTESDFSGVEIVVNRFGDADDVDAAAGEIAGNVLCAVPTNDDHGFDAEAASVIHAQVGIVVDDFLALFDGFVGEGIAAIGGAKDGAAAGKNAADGFLGHFFCAFGPDESIETVADTDDTHVVLIDGGANDGADDGIETGSVAAAVDDR
jgi:hypothetical protein